MVSTITAGQDIPRGIKLFQAVALKACENLKILKVALNDIL